MDWDIGQKAKELDEKTISERVKVDKRSLKKVMLAFLFYFLIMIAFYILL